MQKQTETRVLELETAKPPSILDQILEQPIKKPGIAELLQNEKNWTKQTLARDDRGFIVEVDNKNATCYCLRGAVLKYYNVDNTNDKDYMVKLSKSIKKLFPHIKKEPGRSSRDTAAMHVVEFNNNDKTTFTDIRAVVEDAGI